MTCRRWFYKARHRLIGRDLTDLSEIGSATALSQPEIRRGDPAISLPGQIDKIIDAPHNDLARQLVSAAGGERILRPTMLYELRDVHIFEGSTYSKGRRLYLSPQKNISTVGEIVGSVDEAFIVSSFLGSHFFGHWLRDDMASGLLDVPGTRIDMGWPQWHDQPFYEEVFEISAQKVAEARVRRLFLVDDIYQHAEKAERFRQLRGLLRRKVSGTNPGQIVYLARGRSGTARRCENESEVVEALVSKGAKVIWPEEGDTSSVVSDMLSAKLIISIEGSQLSHALYAIAEDGGILTIQPPRHFFTPHKDWADALGIKFGFIVGDETSHGYTVNVADLLRTIDLLI